MQPLRVERAGYFQGKFSFACDASCFSARLVFSSTEKALCLFNAEHLECYVGPSEWRRSFIWSPTLSLGTSHSAPCELPQPVDVWAITNVQFTDAGTSKSNGESSCELVVILVNSSRSRSLVCCFPSLLESRCEIVISMRGSPSCVEWIYPCTAVDAVFSHSTLHDSKLSPSDTMDISASESKASKKIFLKPVTQSFAGCLSIGFHQGSVALLDLCLDRMHGDCSIGKPELTIATEKAQVLQCVAQGRRVSAAEDYPVRHTFVYLDDSTVRWNEFHYKSVNGRLLNTLPSANVYVSALRFIPNLQSLAVGFSFGGWQLWSLRTLKPEFCLRQASVPAPVNQITFQEPSDDPHYYCYLWVGWQSKINGLEDEDGVAEQDEAKAKLYQLCYKYRFEVPSGSSAEPSYGYHELIGLSERLCTTLFAQGSSVAVMSNQLLSIQPIRYAGVASSTSEGSNQTDAAHLVAFVWRLTEKIIRVGLFDLNRWYHAQMPTQIRSDNSFFAIFDASVPMNNAVSFNGFLVESSLTSFWSRVSKRERQVFALCDRQKLSVYKRSNFENAAVERGAPYPVPEACLRPSALSFSFVIAWGALTGSGSLRQGGFARVYFASRQELCLISLSKFLTEENPTKQFDLVDWLSEAWATGLLDSPGLDPLEEEDLERLLQISGPFSGQDEYRNSSQNRIGLGLAYGEDMDTSLMKSLREIVSVLNPPADSVTQPASKRMRTTMRTPSDTPLLSSDVSINDICLNPAWVLLANCLLEHGHLTVLKSLDRLARGCGPDSPADVRFRQVWLWLRFSRLKSRFDSLTCALFSSASPSIGSSLQTSPDLREMGSVICQISHLAALTRYWFPSGRKDKTAWNLCIPAVVSGITNEVSSFWSAVETFASYTHLVGFFCRMGLLPQSTGSYLETNETTPVFHSVFPNYQPDVLQETVARLRRRAGLSTRESGTTEFTDALLKSSLCISDDTPNMSSLPSSHPARIWLEQEQAVPTSAGSPNSHYELCYPPRRLQSVCALWQLTWTNTLVKSRLGLLGFLLLDATATSAFMQQTRPGNLPTDGALALKLCRHVMSLFVKEFPLVRPLLPTILLIWLLDRGYFKEASGSQLSSAVLNMKPQQDNFRLVSLFPNQTSIVMDYLHKHGELDVLRHLVSFFKMDVESDLSSKPMLSTMDFRPTGAPFLALSRFRNLVNKLKSLQEDSGTTDEQLHEADGIVRDAFIQLAEACRRVGRLGDLINLGLTCSEAQILVDYYRTTGQYGVLFHCLTAREKYQSALSIFDEYKTLRQNGGTTFSSGTSKLEKATEESLFVLSKLVTNSIPGFRKSGRNKAPDIDPASLARALADEFVELDSATSVTPPSGYIAYPRGSALACPLTAAKSASIRKSRKTQYSDTLMSSDSSSSPSSEMDNKSEDRRLRTPLPEHGYGLASRTTADLLASAKKGSCEFWETFRELQDLQRSFDFSTSCRSFSLSNSVLDNKCSVVRQPSGSVKNSTSQSKSNDRLVKLIYTPPSNRLHKRLEKRSTLPLPSLGSQFSSPVTPRGPLHQSQTQQPVSILKSPVRTSIYVVEEEPGPVHNDQNSLNITLEDDADVTLNLSSVRPSALHSGDLDAAPIISPVSTPTPFTFATPRRLSPVSKEARSKPTADVQPVSTPASFEFAVPLSCRRPLHQDSDSPVGHEASIAVVTESDLGGSTMEVVSSVSPDLTDSSDGETLTEASVFTNASKASSSILHGHSVSSSGRQIQAASVSDHKLDDDLSQVPSVSHPPRSTSTPPKELISDDSMDLNDTMSTVSSTASSFSSETPRRSGRRVKQPKRYDPAAY
ncbi:unnamed protein product [Calicophoron daubneyi]|uniref:ELYS beta-propeller domain-containing protein n=1 Tax=Calicophoron daubneyi TaxID=300641 RepID=A0AAV2SZD7_CALDB